jgi:hypothetical protein
MAQYRILFGFIKCRGMAPAILAHIKFFFLKIYRVLLYDLVAMRGFVGSDLGREPVPDVLMVAI